MEGAVIHSLTAGNDENVPCLRISKFTLEQATTVQREEQRYNSTFSLTLALDGGGWSTPRLGSFPPGNERRYLLYSTGGLVDPGPVWSGVKNFVPTGIRSSDRPSCSETLYRQRYPGPSAYYK